MNSAPLTQAQLLRLVAIRLLIAIFFLPVGTLDY